MNIFTRFCATFGAETKFEKARIAATYIDTNQPNEEDIQQILKTLQGEDQQTNIQTAFGSIVRRLKLQNNDENGWILIIKSLIIIDRSVSNRILLKEFNELDLPYIEYRQEKDQKNKQLLINELISKYYTYIKFKSLKLKESTSLTLYKQEKKIYFRQLQIDQIFNELKMILELVQKVYDVVETKKNGHLRYKVNQYLFLLLLNDLIKYYSSGIIGFNLLIKQVEELQTNQLLQLLSISNSMHTFSTKLDEFIYQCRFISGFENVELSYKIDLNIINLLQQYLDYKESNLNGKQNKKIRLNRYDTQAVIDLISQQKMTTKQSEFFGNIVIQQPSKIQIYVNQFKDKYHQDIFNQFQNNFSTKYQPIHQNFKILPEPIIEEDTDFLQKVEEDQNNYHFKEQIDFIYPDAFDETIFIQFQNQFNK